MPTDLMQAPGSKPQEKSGRSRPEAGQVTLACEDGAVTVTAAGTTYALNEIAAGMAHRRGWRDAGAMLRSLAEGARAESGAADPHASADGAFLVALLEAGRALEEFAEQDGSARPTRSARRS